MFQKTQRRGSVGTLLEDLCQGSCKEHVEGQATRVREIFTEDMALAAGLAGCTGVCRAAVIGSHPDFRDSSFRLLGDLEAWSLPTRGFLEKMGPMNPTRQWGKAVGERARKGGCGSECMEGSGRGKRAWAGVALKHYPKIISFCNPVHFFLGMIQFCFVLFFSAGFLA